MTKKSRKKQPLEATETLEERLERVAIDTITRAEVESDISTRVSAVRAAALVLGEKRKAEKAAASRFDALTPATVIEWFRVELTAQERTQLLRELEHINTKRSGLA